MGRVVRHCVEKDLDLRSLSREDLRAFHPAFPADAAELLDLEGSLEARSLAGGTAAQTVRDALERVEGEIERQAADLGAGEERS